jgi:hypothetical protein
MLLRRSLATGASGAILRRSLASTSGFGLPSLQSSSNFIDLDDDLDRWPRSKVNSILNVCAQGERMVVERLGKLNEIKESG